MRRKVSEVPTVYYYVTLKLRRTRDTKLVDFFPEILSMYSYTLYLFDSRVGCSMKVNDFKPLLQLSVCNLIAWQNMLMLTKQSCLKLMTSVSSLHKVKTMTSRTPPKDAVHVFQYNHDPTELDHPISKAPACRGNHFDPFFVVQQDSIMGITSSCSRICSADSNTIQ
jgi:hypothetical protein